MFVRSGVFGSSLVSEHNEASDRHESRRSTGQPRDGIEGSGPERGIDREHHAGVAGLTAFPTCIASLSTRPDAGAAGRRAQPRRRSRAACAACEARLHKVIHVAMSARRAPAVLRIQCVFAGTRPQSGRARARSARCRSHPGRNLAVHPRGPARAVQASAIAFDSTSHRLTRSTRELISGVWR